MEHETSNKQETANSDLGAVMCRLTPAQKREYELLKKHGSVYVYGWQRRGVFERLKDKGLCYSQDWHWFHLNGT